MSTRTGTFTVGSTKFTPQWTGSPCKDYTPAPVKDMADWLAEFDTAPEVHEEWTEPYTREDLWLDAEFDFDDFLDSFDSVEAF